MKIQMLISTGVYIISLIFTHFYYPYGEVRDLETDKVIGMNYGVTKWHVILIFVFSSINNLTFANINRSNSIGVRPTTMIDLFMLNNVIMILYSFYAKVLWLYALIPL